MRSRQLRESGRKTSRAAVLSREVRKSIEAWKGFEVQRGLHLAQRMMTFERALKLVTLSALVLAILIAALPAQAAILSLKATWTPNTETDMASYNLYRTDGTRLKINPAPIAHPPVLPYTFSITVPDNSSGTLTFVLTAVDRSGNESADSVPATLVYDLVPPSRPTGLSVGY